MSDPSGARTTRPGVARRLVARLDAGCAVVAVALVLMAAIPVLLALWYIGDVTGYDITRACDAEDPFLRPRAAVTGRTVEIAGTTNLPDGARIWVSYWQQSYPTHDDATTVRDGRFAFTSDLTDHPAGTVTAELEFSIGWRSPDQPAEIAERYGGESAQCLWGAEQAVSDSGDPPKLLAPVTFELPSA